MNDPQTHHLNNATKSESLCLMLTFANSGTMPAKKLPVDLLELLNDHTFYMKF